MDKDTTSKHHPEEDVELWRSSFDAQPPSLTFNDYRHPMHDHKYSMIPRDHLPKVESMKDTVDRIVPFWYNTIAREILNNKKVVIVAHKNSLRAIFSHLQKIGEEEIKQFKVPNALPLVYEFDENLNHINNYALMDMDAYKIKKENKDLSYNNIDMRRYQ
jgi:2,3-bisphosphoglycerate-dependent phosphoglycerate mutase